MDGGTALTASPKDPTTAPIRPPSKYPTGARLAVGTIVTYLVASLLYGPALVLQAVAFATICTLGLGGLLILFFCWLVGWFVLALWSELGPQSRPAAR